jgi:hypothetical protein
MNFLKNIRNLLEDIHSLDKRKNVKWNKKLVSVSYTYSSLDYDRSTIQTDKKLYIIQNHLDDSIDTCENNNEILLQYDSISDYPKTHKEVYSLDLGEKPIKRCKTMYNISLLCENNLS